MEIAINILIFLVGGYWVQQGISVYKFWLKGVPGSGFMPVLFGVLLMVFSGYLLVQAVRKLKQDPGSEAKEGKPATAEGKYPVWIRPLVPAVYTLLAIGLMVLTGVIPAMFLTAFLWLFCISKVKLGKSLLITTIVTLFVFLVFVLWLKIPFPRGVFGI